MIGDLLRISKGKDSGVTPILTEYQGIKSSTYIGSCPACKHEHVGHFVYETIIALPIKNVIQELFNDNGRQLYVKVCLEKGAQDLRAEPWKSCSNQVCDEQYRCLIYTKVHHTLGK